jgi:hypothetical protein
MREWLTNKRLMRDWEGKKYRRCGVETAGCCDSLGGNFDQKTDMIVYVGCHVSIPHGLPLVYLIFGVKIKTGN